MTGFQVMPALSDDEYRALEQSIREHGVQVPVTVAPDGRIVDGHHRAEIADKLDRHCPRVTAQGDDTELRTLAFELNNHRRQQGREARRGQVRKSLRADPQLSNREHARRTGVHHETVQSIRADMEAGGEIRHLDYRENPQGRPQPASKPERPEPEIDLANVDRATGEIHDEPVGEFVSPYTEIAEAAKRKVTGLDDKNYSRPEPRKPRRKALTDAARDAGWELRKAVERLQRIAEDDRFSRNKEEVTPLLRGHLINAVEVCQDLLDQIDPEGN